MEAMKRPSSSSFPTDKIWNHLRFLQNIEVSLPPFLHLKTVFDVVSCWIKLSLWTLVDRHYQCGSSALKIDFDRAIQHQYQKYEAIYKFLSRFIVIENFLVAPFLGNGVEFVLASLWLLVLFMIKKLGRGIIKMKIAIKSPTYRLDTARQSKTMRVPADKCSSSLLLWVFDKWCCSSSAPWPTDLSHWST